VLNVSSVSFVLAIELSVNNVYFLSVTAAQNLCELLIASERTLAKIAFLSQKVCLHCLALG